MGHLRPVKDPFRTALAARLLPPSSRVRVLHLGAALSEEMAEQARARGGRQPALPLAGGTAALEGVARAGAEPAAVADVGTGGRRQRGLRGAGRIDAGAVVAHRRHGRAAGRGLPRLLPGRRRGGPGPAVGAGRNGRGLLPDVVRMVFTACARWSIRNASGGAGKTCCANWGGSASCRAVFTAPSRSTSATPTPAPCPSASRGRSSSACPPPASGRSTSPCTPCRRPSARPPPRCR